ncbi:MAG: diacylglycerol kinase family lipid kinase [Bacteroidales bacterium]|nr:diacylglycerol kinase family lipid kinase [Bacteroidales bacterium]
MKKIAFIVNPISGGKNKKKIISMIEARMAGTGLDWKLCPTEYAGHAISIAHDADADVVVAVGGDGTVSEVAQGLLGTGKALAIIPCGSGDGLALHLGYSRTPKKALEQILSGVQVSMDSGSVNGHPFFCTTGVGFDADVALAFAKAGKRGLKTYVSKSWSIWKHYKPLTYKITVDGNTHELPAMFVTVGNANQWGNRAKITPEASVCDGLLDVTAVKPFHFWQFPALGIRLFTGSANKSSKVVHLRGQHVSILRPVTGAIHFDGDPSEMGETLDVSISKGVLTALVPSGRENKI